MSDYALGIVGIALTVIFGAWSLAPEKYRKLPNWLYAIICGVGLLLFGLGLGMWVGGQESQAAPDLPALIETALFLEFADTTSVPNEKNVKNIKYWCAYHTGSISVNEQDITGKQIGGFSVPPQWIVFIIFERAPIIQQLLVTCTGLNKPKCDVQAANSAYAVVTAVGDMTNATLEISLAP
jgi:hypothetical protein